MTPAAIWREAWRDVTSGTARTVTCSLLLVLLTLGLGAAELLTVRALTAEAEAFQEAGASIITLAAPGRIDPTACDALGTVPGVRAAGAIRATDESITPSSLPSSTIPVVHATPPLPEVLRATTHGPGIILSSQAATSLSLATGDPLGAHEATTPVAGTYSYPDDGRRAGLGYAALVPSPERTPFDECWVDIWPTSSQTPVLLRTALLPSSEDDAPPPVLGQLNPTLGTSFDGSARFDARVTRSAPLVALALGAGLGAFTVRLRRTQLASALHAGVTRRDLAAVLALETTSWTLPAGVIAMVGSVLVATLGHDHATAVLTARVASAGVLGPFVGSAVMLALTRERHLFRYFKDR